MSNKDENKYPLHPELSLQGKVEAQAVIERFKNEMKSAADNAIGDIYCEAMHHIESDSWSNFRSSIVIALSNYGSTGEDKIYPNELKAIRDSVFKDHREELLKDLNQDLLAEIDRLLNIINK